MCGRNHTLKVFYNVVVLQVCIEGYVLRIKRMTFVCIVKNIKTTLIAKRGCRVIEPLKEQVFLYLGRLIFVSDALCRLLKTRKAPNCVAFYTRPCQFAGGGGYCLGKTKL